MNFTIDRSKWMRGDSDPKLVRASDGKMCCLGFFLLACGVPRDVLVDYGEPQEPFQAHPEATLPEAAEWLVEVTEPDEDDTDDYGDLVGDEYACSDVGGDLIEANDATTLTEEERERRISMLLYGQGVEVEFVDGSSESESKSDG